MKEPNAGTLWDAYLAALRTMTSPTEKGIKSDSASFHAGKVTFGHDVFHVRVEVIRSLPAPGLELP